MKTTLLRKFCFLFSGCSFLLIIFFSAPALAQNNSASFESEIATCTITVNNRTYLLKPNQIGYFERIAGIIPMAVIPIELYYPNGTSGEKVLLSVEDGGNLGKGENVKVLQLNSFKIVSFSFQLSDQPGIHRLSVKKGGDTKVIQLWVGLLPPSVQ